MPVEKLLLNAVEVLEFWSLVLGAWVWDNEAPVLEVGLRNSRGQDASSWSFGRYKYRDCRFEASGY